MLLLTTALSRSQCAKKSSKDCIMKTFLKTNSSFCCNWYTHESLDMGCIDSVTQFPWITQNILKKSYICFCGFPLPLASNFPHSPGNQRVKVHKQADIVLCPMNWKKQQPIELEDHSTFLLTFLSTTLWDRQVHWAGVNTSLPCPQESDTLLQVLSDEMACE